MGNLLTILFESGILDFKLDEMVFFNEKLNSMNDLILIPSSLFSPLNLLHTQVDLPHCRSKQLVPFCSYPQLGRGFTEQANYVLLSHVRKQLLEHIGFTVDHFTHCGVVVLAQLLGVGSESLGANNLIISHISMKLLNVSFSSTLEMQQRRLMSR